MESDMAEPSPAWPPPPGPTPVPAGDEVKFSDDPVQHSTISMCILVLILITWLVLGHKIQGMFKWTRWVSEGSMACLMGLVSGLALLIYDRTHEHTIRKSLSFDSASFFTYMLPPIIFYGGLAIERKLFVSNLLSIMSFGVLGTFVSFAILGTTLYWLSLLPNILRFTDCLSLAAIFAATDSVSVLQVLRPDSHPALYSIVLGEGVMNDATSVALLNTVRLLGEDARMSTGTAFWIVSFFLYLFVCSCALGLGAGLSIAMCMKRLGPFSEPQEVGLVGALAYISYLFAELLGLSGILTLFFCGMAVSNYALQHLSRGSRAALVGAFRTLSYLLEGIIFLYVGRDALDPGKWQHAQVIETIYLVIFIVALIAFSRAIFVFPLAWLHNRWSSATLLFGDGVAIWWAGMMRGAVSVAMVYYSFDPNNTNQDSHSATIVVTTLAVVLTSTVILGGVTGPLLKMVLNNPVKPPALNGNVRHLTGSSMRSPSWRLLRHTLIGSNSNFNGESDDGGGDTRRARDLTRDLQPTSLLDDDDSLSLLKPAPHTAVELSAAIRSDLARQGVSWDAAGAKTAPRLRRDRLDPQRLFRSASPHVANGAASQGAAQPPLRADGATAACLLPDAAPSEAFDRSHVAHDLLGQPASPPAPAFTTRDALSDGTGSPRDARALDACAAADAGAAFSAPPALPRLIDPSPSTNDLAMLAAQSEQREARLRSQSVGDLRAAAAGAGTPPPDSQWDAQVWPHRMLSTAQGWADRADWDSRVRGAAADGGLGEAMYSRFQQFDAKYMQPLFGADNPSDELLDPGVPLEAAPVLDAVAPSSPQQSS